MRMTVHMREETDSFPLHRLDEIVYGNNHDLIRENANMDGQSPMGTMSRVASEAAKFYAKQKLLSEDVRQAAVEWLARRDAPDHFVTLVRDGGSLDAAEQGLVFGESLPKGLRLS